MPGFLLAWSSLQSIMIKITADFFYKSSSSLQVISCRGPCSFPGKQFSCFSAYFAIDSFPDSNKVQLCYAFQGQPKLTRYWHWTITESFQRIWERQILMSDSLKVITVGCKLFWLKIIIIQTWKTFIFCHVKFWEHCSKFTLIWIYFNQRNCWWAF